MSQSIRDFIEAIDIVDVHEHHIPQILLNPQDSPRTFNFLTECARNADLGQRAGEYLA